MFGFLLPIRFFNDLMASLGCTVFDRMRSEISRLVAISSRLEDVARSICSSSADVPDVNQPAMLPVMWFLAGRASAKVLGGLVWRIISWVSPEVKVGGRLKPVSVEM